MMHRFMRRLFPPKCVLCRKRLSDNENDLCRKCRTEVPSLTFSKKKISFVAGWVCLWYYGGMVRRSILHYKFYGKWYFAKAYGRLLAMRLMTENMTDFDVLTYVPTSFRRKLKRGYDQVRLLAKYTAAELGVPYEKVLIKHRHTPTQSSIKGIAQRRANVLGAYRVSQNARLEDKKVLLLDDIITTGATLSECARVLLTAGAKEVKCAALAASEEITKVKR